MAREFEHLDLPRWEGEPPRRKTGSARPPQRDNQHAHGREIHRQALEVEARLDERLQIAPPGINPKLVFKIQLHRQGHLDEESLRKLGLRVLARDARKAIVVFPDQRTLDELKRHLREYSGLEPGHIYGFLSSVDEISEIPPEEKIGRRLHAAPLDEDEVVPLDIELWHSGDRNECRRIVAELTEHLARSGMAVTDSYVGESVCLVRARLNGAVLDEVLGSEYLDYIREVDRRPAPAFEMLEVNRLGIEEINIAEAIPADAVGIVMVDSGIMQLHPLIGPALGDAQVFPDSLLQRIRGGPEDGDERTHGHGTAVGGIAIYGDVGECIASRAFNPSARLFSARVTDDQNQYDEDELVEHQLEEAVTYFLVNYPQAKVINISLGDRALVYSDQDYQFRLAATVDELAYRFRDREILFVVSSGNYSPEKLTSDDILEQYPGYLFEDSARLIDPATAALALSVGGLSYGPGRHYQEHLPEGGVERLVAGERGYPSPFTRVGWGMGGSIKPDVVDYAGDWRFERGNIPNNPGYAGVPTTAKRFAPPEGRLFRTVSGTSFSAPRVSNLAARLFHEFPGSQSNLVRALIATSARVPGNRPPGLTNMDVWEDRILRIYGYGQPDFDRARWSAENDALLVAEEELGVDSFHMYIIPSLPDEFLSARGSGYVSVALAFDPPTRHTRADSYLGVTMEFDLFRNIRPEELLDHIRELQQDEREEFGNDYPKKGNLRDGRELPVRVQLRPSSKTRKRGTLQRGILKVSRSNWQYDREELVLAVICRRKWAPPDITHQRYAVVVSVSHENDEVNLYARIREQTRVYQRVRVQV